MKSTIVYSLTIWLISTYVGPILCLIFWSTNPWSNFESSQGFSRFFGMIPIMAYFSMLFSWIGFIIMMISHHLLKKLPVGNLNKRILMTVLGCCSVIMVFMIGSLVVENANFLEWRVVLPYCIVVSFCTMIIKPDKQGRIESK